ncbi:MAG: Hsp20/alpha crystallin family protein [Spirochaetes bacterium]|nr:Hsp20/alpha crystallin family protein [Spirochaetota bacterium]
MYTYDIFDDIFNLKDTVNSYFNDYTGRWKSREFPNMEIYEGKDELEVRALVPGVKADNLNINLVDNNLVIEGEKKNDYADNPYIRRERQFGAFKKSVKLPYRVDPGTISAELTNGILHVKLHKSEDAKPKKIEIK